MAVRLVAVNVEVVLAIFIPGVAKLSGDDSHRVIEPVYPLKVKIVELVPVQTVALPAIDPPTAVGMAVMVAVVLLSAAHAPLVTTAL